jgi:hypothetical protein
MKSARKLNSIPAYGGFFLHLEFAGFSSLFPATIDKD